MFDDFWPFQHLEMAVPVTELIPQQLGYFERGSAHTLELRSIYPLKDRRRRTVEKELVYIVYSCYTGDFGRPLRLGTFSAIFGTWPLNG